MNVILMAYFQKFLLIGIRVDEHPETCEEISVSKHRTCKNITSIQT